MTLTKTQETSKYEEVREKEQLLTKDAQISRNGLANVNFDQGKSSDYEIFRVDKIKWFNVIFLTVVHLYTLYGMYRILKGDLTLKLFLFHYIVATVYGQGITAGAHRLWAHKAYTAKLPLRIFLMLLNCGALQTPLYDWVRDHRVHHAFTDTNIDPHNSTRGFFFSHVGWLFFRKHPDVGRIGKSVDMSDILSDPVVQFQKKYYLPLSTIMTLVIPLSLQCYLFGSTISFALLGRITAYGVSLNATWSVNSVAHIWGTKPYQKNVTACQNLFVSMVTMGEGWHNYHHMFPWDYKASELPFLPVDFTTWFLNRMADIGLATNLRTPSKETIKKRILSAAKSADLNSEKQSKEID